MALWPTDDWWDDDESIPDLSCAWLLPPCPRCAGGQVLATEDGVRVCSYCGGYPTGIPL